MGTVLEDIFKMFVSRMLSKRLDDRDDLINRDSVAEIIVTQPRPPAISAIALTRRSSSWGVV